MAVKLALKAQDALFETVWRAPVLDAVVLARKNLPDLKRHVGLRGPAPLLNHELGKSRAVLLAFSTLSLAHKETMFATQYRWKSTAVNPAVERGVGRVPGRRCVAIHHSTVLDRLLLRGLLPQLGCVLALSGLLLARRPVADVLHTLLVMLLLFPGLLHRPFL